MNSHTSRKVIFFGSNLTILLGLASLAVALALLALNRREVADVFVLLSHVALVTGFLFTLGIAGAVFADGE